MPMFSRMSHLRLDSCHEDLKIILLEAIKHVDFSVLCGFRTAEEQEEAFRTGRSSKRWPNSKHNKMPALAVDVAPYPIDWADTARFARLFGYIERIADEKGIKIRWGADWNENGRTNDERLIDMPHIELVDVRGSD